MIFPVSERKSNMKNQTIIAPPSVRHDGFRGIAPLVVETRMAQMRGWKAIPESKRPTWEEFKRGFKVKKR
jgi:hypothetical protein